MTASPPTISLCMIVKNEAEHLACCLNSIAPHVDEIIIVDTGSSDNTLEIADFYGAKLFFSAWQGDFSLARNQSLTYATMDWVLILDADEEVPYESAAHLKSLLIKEPEAEAWLFTIASYTEKGAPPIKHPNLRLFRNRPFYKFSGKIHEQIKPSIVSCNPSAQIRHTNLTIFHHGYTQQEMIRKQKNQRNIEILQRELKEDPANPFHHYNLGVSFAAQQSFKQARKHFEAAYTNLKGYMGFEPNLFRDYALCLINLFRFTDALKILEEGLAHFPDYPDLHYIQGQTWKAIKKRTQAKASFKKCASFRRIPSRYTTSEGIASHLALQQLAELAIEEKKYTEAIDYLRQIILIKPSSHTALSLGKCLQQAGYSGADIAGYLTELPGLDSGLDPDLIPKLLYNLKEYSVSLHLLDQCAGQCKNHIDHTALKAGCLLHLRRRDELEAVFQQEGKNLGQSSILFSLFCLNRWMMSPRKSAADITKKIKLSDHDLLKACLWIDSLVICQEDMPAEKFPPADRAAALVMDLAREACCFGDNDLGLAIANEFSKKYTCTMSHPLLSLAWDLFRHNHLDEANTFLASCQTESDNTASCRAEMHFLQGEIYAQQGLTERSCQASATALSMEPANERYGSGALEKLLALCLEAIEELPVLPNANNMLEQQKTAYLGWKLKAQYIKEAVGHEKK